MAGNYCFIYQILLISQIPIQNELWNLFFKKKKINKKSITNILK